MEDNWIKVEDKLPEEFTHVLVWANISIDAGYAYYAIGNWLYFTNQENFWLSKQPHIKVTHWQPLPNPPKIKI